MDDFFPLTDEVSQALVGDGDPARLESYRFATRILSSFDLIRSLFTSSRLDTCLRLMVLHELVRTSGRSSLERIRRLVSFLEPERVESAVRSLREGGWLELSATDNTYTVSLLGVALLNVLLNSHLDTLSDANQLSRAAQCAAFGATLDGAKDNTPYFLEQLHALLISQVDEAKAVLQSGRPRRMIAWNQRQHGRQLEVIRGVLGALQERLEASSALFAQVTRLHLAMQEIVRLHASLHTRLRDWNLERLYSSEAGYSVAQLCDAILGVDEEVTWQSDAVRRIVQRPVAPPTLTVDEIRSRFHGARRRLPSQEAPFTYAPPPEPAAEDFSAADLEPAAALRAHLSALMAEKSPSDPPLTLGEWLPAQLTEAVYSLAILGQLQAAGSSFPLDDGRTASLSQKQDLMRNLGAEDLLSVLTDLEVLTRLPAGTFSALSLRPEQAPIPHHDSQPTGDLP